MSDEVKPEDNEATRRYSLWRDLSANARFPSEDFVARAALHSRSERNPDEGLSQFRSEYPLPLQETAEQVSVPVALPPPPPDRTSAVNAKMAAAVAALFVVGFAAAVGLKQFQTPATAVAQAPSSQPRPVNAPSTSSLDTLASAQPGDVPSDSSASRPIASTEAAAVVSEPPASPAKASIERTPSLADTLPTSTSAGASTTPQPERPAAGLSASARSIVASTPSIPPAPVTAPDPAPIAVNRETAVNATATGPVDVAVPAAVRNTPVATTGGDVPAVASAPSTTDADLRPAPLDRPVPALSTAAPAPIAAPTVTPAAAIQRTLQGYQSAFSRLDVNAVRQVWPSVDQKALAKAFDQLKSEDLTLENCKVTVTGANAVAACGGKTEYVPKIGSKNARIERHQWRISLQQVADRWVVHQVDVTAP